MTDDQSPRAGDGKTLGAFLAAMMKAHQAYPLDHWTQPDGQVCFRSAGTEHAWRGWLLAAAPAAAPAWQPIETAPEDGSHLILACDGQSFIGVWFELPFREFRDVDGFYVGQQDAEAYWMRISDGDQCEPTHWMPLPAAPAFQAPATGDRHE